MGLTFCCRAIFSIQLILPTMTMPFIPLIVLFVLLLIGIAYSASRRKQQGHLKPTFNIVPQTAKPLKILKPKNNELLALVKHYIDHDGKQCFTTTTAKVEASLWLWAALTLSVKRVTYSVAGPPPNVPHYLDMKSVAVDLLEAQFPEVDNFGDIFFERLDCYTPGFPVYVERLTQLCLMSNMKGDNDGLIDDGLPNIFAYTASIFDVMELQSKISDWMQKVFNELDQAQFYRLVIQEWRKGL